MPRRCAAWPTSDDFAEQIGLRAFELVLLKAIGLLPELDRVTATQQRAATPTRRYHLLGDRGVVERDPRCGRPLPGADAGRALRATLGALHVLRDALDRLKPVLRALGRCGALLRTRRFTIISAARRPPHAPGACSRLGAARPT